jgi:type IV pilus assembly protein PilA
MKQKGFTLTELLAVIVILGVTAMIAIPAVTKSLKSYKKNLCDEQVANIKEAARVWGSDHLLELPEEGETKTITLGDLQDNGYIDKDIKDPRNSNNEISRDITITITKKKKKYTYTVNYSCDSSTESDTTTGDSSDNTETQPEEEPITLKEGNYIKMTPTSESYNIDNSLTGCQTSTSACSNGYQTIKPNELTLWRVIRKNKDDNTYDAVSVYTSSTAVTFYGQTGYLNFVGTLNTIAKQYKNESYTTGARMMGYDKQTENLDSSKVQFINPAPWTSSTSDDLYEKVGGGDIQYQTDTDLVSSEQVFGTLVANKVGTTTASYYWLASRYYLYLASSSYGWIGRYVFSSGSISNSSLCMYYSGWYSYSPAYAVRPIITLRTLYADDIKSGTGTEDDPYVLE